MATVQISELTAISTATTDDNFIINDGNAATRRITFADLVTSVANQAITFTQDITFSGATSGISIDELSDVDTTTAAPTSGQVLKWSGTNWAPADDSLSAAFELGTGEILNRAATRGHVIKLRNLSDVNKILLNTGTGDIDSQGNISGAEIQVNGNQIALTNLSDGGALTTLTGVVSGSVDLGTFSGTTINDNVTIKAALQALETSLEAIDIDTDDLAALTGISENTTNLGTFTGSTISDNVAVKTALQEIETALELKAAASAVSNVDNTSDANKPISTATQTALDLKAPLATPTFTNHVFSPEYRAAGTGHLKLRAETGNDLIIYLADSETLQITRDPSTGNPKFTAKGGTGECEFLQSVNLDAGFKIGGVAVSATAAELNILDGVTATTAELNILDGVTSTAAELNILDGVTADATELNYLDGVTSGVQTQIDARATLAGGNTFTGTQVVRDKIDIKPADSTYFLRLNRNTATQLDIATGNIPSGGNLNIKNSNGTDAKVVVYSDLFWVRNLGGSNGNGTAKFDGDVTFTPSASVTPADNGQLMVEATDNTTLTFKLKGSDGTVRSGTITLS